MQVTIVVATLLAAMASATNFTLYADPLYLGSTHFEDRFDDGACCTYNLSENTFWSLTGSRES
jgi:hypothetical protein